MKKGNVDKAIDDFTEAIRLDSRYAMAYYNRGLAYEKKGEPDKAVADLDAVVRLRPKSLFYIEVRAAARIQHGDYEGGIADLRTAVRLDPNDPAAKFEAWPKEALTAAAIQHGEQQVRQMLRDRPAMAQFGEKAEVLYHWAERKFAGEDLHPKYSGMPPNRFLLMPTIGLQRERDRDLFGYAERIAMG